MFSFMRKARSEPQESWDQAKADYENAIKRCYCWKTVTLALCCAQKFVAFNFKYRNEDSPFEFHEADFKFYGVVHELGQETKHVRFEMEVVDAPVVDGTIGHLVLTHLCSLSDEKTIRSEEHELELNVMLRDSTSKLKNSLISGLRDAALSGYRFMHVELGFVAPTSDDADIAISSMREKGYGPRRDIIHVKMWPKVELEKSPVWARQKD